MLEIDIKFKTRVNDTDIFRIYLIVLQYLRVEMNRILQTWSMERVEFQKPKCIDTYARLYLIDLMVDQRCPSTFCTPNTTYKPFIEQICLVRIMRLLNNRK